MKGLIMKKVTVVLIGVVLLLTGLWAGGQTAPAAKAPALMARLEMPDAEWLQMYADQPVGEVIYTYNLWRQRGFIANQAKMLQELDRRLTALEHPADPNEVTP
jgi:hypothetical protein